MEPTRAQLYAVAHVIDGQRFMTIRVQARLSQRAVARAAGVTLPVVRGAEEGRSQQMTLALVTRLAAALGCSVEEILEPSSVAPTVEGEASTSPGVDRKKKDAKRLEAVLFTAGKLVHYRALAEVLGFSVQRLREAAEYLEAHAEDRGIRFYRLNVQWGLRPAVASGTMNDICRVERHKVASDGLKRSQARILYEIFRDRRAGRNRRYGLDRKGAQVELGSLLNAGILVRGSDGRMMLGREVQWALEPARVPAHALADDCDEA